MENNLNIQVINNLYKAFAIGDMPNVLGAMHPEIVWNEAESNSLANGNPYIGPDAILNGVFACIGDMYESFTLKNIELHNMMDNKVLATLRYHLKSKISSKKFNVQVAHLWMLNAKGKITGFQQFVDTKKLADSEIE